MPLQNACLSEIMDEIFDNLRVLQAADDLDLLTEVEGKAVEAMLQAGLQVKGEWFMEDHPEG
jgi:hypothetical protein